MVARHAAKQRHKQMNKLPTTKRRGLQGQAKATKSAPRKDDEHQLQVACVNWFHAQPQYKRLYNLFFAVPNGGARSKMTAAKLKAEGVKRGVADLLLIVPSGTYYYLAIEMKTSTGTQSDSQKEFQKSVDIVGGKYVVCRSLEQFIHAVQSYMNGEFIEKVG